MTKRRRLPASESRRLILEAAERVLRAHGFAMLNLRRVAAEAGTTTSLLHYHFETLEDLLVTFYRHIGEKHRLNIEAAFASDRPIRALWDINNGGDNGQLVTEMIGLGYRYESIRAELAFHVEAFRKMQAEAFAKALRDHPGLAANCSPDAGVFVMTAVATALMTDRGVGISVGHADTIALVERWIDALEGPEPRPAAGSVETPGSPSADG